MRISLRSAVALAIAAASGATHAQDFTDQTLETVLITAKREDRVSKGATGLDLAIKDTPQSISVVTSEWMDDFGADEINDALRLATGINVEEWETNRTNYMSRGFEIKNTQIDGVGLPNDWGIVTGAMDSFGYEKIEVIRGANGLLTGVGNASGTINYVRKRPTNETQGLLSLSAGSFDERRIEADYSTPFTADGGWAGRIVVAAEDQDSWVRGLSNDRAFVYGVIDGQIGEKSTLTLGYSYQKANTDGNMWGALVLANSDGSQAEFGRSASTTQDWTFWDTENQTAFAEYTYELANDWDLKVTYNYRTYEDDSQLFFAFSNEGLDPETREGLVGWPGSWPTEDESHLVDSSVNGKLELFGREHELIVGASYATSERTQFTRPVAADDPAFAPLPAFPYGGNVVPEPAWGTVTVDSETNQRLKRLYGASRWSLTDKLATIIGFNWSEYHRDGFTSIPFDQTERELSPYAGVTYAIVDNVLAYASYSDIYQPQDQYDITDQFLDPSKGVNYEVGVKADWFEQRLLTTLAWFSAKQKDLATFAGLNEATGNYFYKGVDVDSDGVELEVAGRVNDNIDVILGFTSLNLDGADGENYDWVPRRTANLAITTRVPGLNAVALGINGRWQSDTSKIDEYTGVRVRQDSYATVNAFARWNATEQLSVRANLENLTDEKYITSLYQIGYYGPPRHYSVSLNYRF